MLLLLGHVFHRILNGQVEISSDEKVNAAKEQGRAHAASEMNALQEELQRLQLRRNADADATRKVLSLLRASFRVCRLIAFRSIRLPLQRKTCRRNCTAPSLQCARNCPILSLHTVPFAFLSPLTLARQTSRTGTGGQTRCARRARSSSQSFLTLIPCDECLDFTSQKCLGFN